MQCPALDYNPLHSSSKFKASRALHFLTKEPSLLPSQWDTPRDKRNVLNY